ncbi:MAG: methyl-accepting chemotaxis protein [Candidatus Sulfotelmatobacter sp.]
MRKLSLKVKLGVGFGALLLIVALLGGIGYNAAITTEALSRTVQSESGKKDLALAIKLAIEREKVGSREALLNGDMKPLESGRADYKDKMDALRPLLLSDQSKKLLADIEQVNAKYDAISDRAIKLHKAGKAKEALAVFYGTDAQEMRTDLKKSTADLADWCGKRSTEAVDQQAANDAHTKTLMLVLPCVGLVIGVVIAILIALSITGAISKMVAMIQEIEANNLAVADMEITSEDEIGKASKALNSMKNNLRAVIQSMANAANQVASASEEISSGSTQSAESARSQSDQTHQAATAMQEMSSTVQQISENSQKASETSRQAAQAARQGGEVVQGTLASMRNIADATSKTAAQVTELGKSSEQIGKIIAVIDDIADQTNLLALNAAIEAARAGEQGRGFAVVADEVRKLAERTTKATKEIASMIESIQSETKNAVHAMELGNREVQVGVEKTSASGVALQEIIKMSENVGDMISQIATAATQQSATTEQINANVVQISSATQETSAAAEQTAKACQDLSSLAFDLQNLVNQFKLDSASHPAEHRESGASQAKPKAAAAAAGASH